MKDSKVLRKLLLIIIFNSIFLLNGFYFSIYDYRIDIYQENLENNKNQHIYMVNNNTLHYSIKWIFDFGGTTTSRNMKIYPDLNGDGYDDIIVYSIIGSLRRLTALTHNGDVIWNVKDFSTYLNTYDGSIIRSHESLSWYFPGIYDENGDSIMDIIGSFTNNSAGILDGKSGNILWSGTPFGTYNQMLGMLEDFTGDGKPEIVMKNGNDYGVFNSSSKTMIWSNTYSYSPHVHAIPDIDGDGIWDVITGANFVNHIDCWSGFNGTNIWSHPIGYDSWAESICPDQNSDGYFDVLVTPQQSEFELISGKTGFQIWGSGNIRSGRPRYVINEKGTNFTMHDHDGVVKTYYLLNGTFINSIPSCKWTRDHFFLENPYYDLGIFQIIYLDNDSVALYAVGDNSTIVQFFNNNYLYGSPYYGNSSCPAHDLIFMNETHLAFFTEPLSYYPALISNGEGINIFLIMFSSTLGIIVLVVSALYLLRKKGIIIPSKKVVYLSYSEPDFKHFNISEIAKRLESYPKIDKVIFQKMEEIKVGAEYVEQKLKDSNVFLLFCSSNTMNSEKLKDEWQPAFQLRKKGLMKMIPVFENDEDIPVVLLHLPRIEFSKNTFNVFIEKLYKEIIRRD